MNLIIIPAYQPNQSLLQLVKALCDYSLSIIIVNDGSGAHYAAIFAELAHMKAVTVLSHEHNMGKGQALKTAFHYFLTHYPPTFLNIITADADGQHLPKDIYRLCQKSHTDPHALWLGTRYFNRYIPWRSRFGNKLTCFIFGLLTQHTLQDTQTGLRAIPRNFLSTLLNTKSMGYDFELEMLICALKANVELKEIPITTVYENNNQNSHFRPFLDSFKIYFIFLRFLRIKWL